VLESCGNIHYRFRNVLQEVDRELVEVETDRIVGLDSAIPTDDLNNLNVGNDQHQHNTGETNP
jgi:hypothetical protein